MASNTLLTVDQITKEALRILHQKLNFIGNVNRSYDDRFANSGAKIGDTLRIRLPNQYTVRTGRVIDVQDTNEKKEDLTVSTQKGVDTEFTSNDLTMDLDSFSTRILEPAMTVLASHVESDALSMYKNVYQEVDNSASSVTFANALNCRKKMVDSLTPSDGQWAFCMDTQMNVDLVDTLKGLFHESSQVSKQYKEGLVGQTAGFRFYENTLLHSHTAGKQDGNIVTNGADQDGSTITVDGDDDGVIEIGDVFTIAGVNRVHPETKTDTGNLQEFVATSKLTGAGNVDISPEIIASGAYQNVTNKAGDDKSLTFHGSSDTAHNISLAFHRDAFAFATADLVMPEGVDFASRQVYDGISMRIVRQYDINNDMFPCRIDILYGYKAIQPQLAARLAAN